MDSIFLRRAVIVRVVVWNHAAISQVRSMQHWRNWRILHGTYRPIEVVLTLPLRGCERYRHLLAIELRVKLLVTGSVAVAQTVGQA